MNGKGILGQIPFPFHFERLSHRLYRNHLTKIFLYHQLQNVEALFYFKLLLVILLWDITLPPSLPPPPPPPPPPPSKVAHLSFEHGLLLLPTFYRGEGGITSTRSWTGHMNLTKRVLSSFATGFSTSNTSNASFRFFQNGQVNLLMSLIKHMTSFYLFLDLSLTLEAQLKMFQIMLTLW